MSTRCTLDPMVRENRKRRAQLVREAAVMRDKAAEDFGPFSEQASTAAEIAGFLGAIHRCPRRTGARKNRLFRQIARELTHGQSA